MGGFSRKFERKAREDMDECWRKAIKAGCTATVSGTVY